MTHRTPKTKAEISGAIIKNPSRYAKRNTPLASEIGDPPERLDAEQREAWEQFAAEIPWLNRSHRAIVELAARLRAKVTAGYDGINHFQVYSAILSKLGATPVDASRVFTGGPDESDPSDKFFN